MDGAKRIAEICKEADVKRLIHVSSMLAIPDSPSLFQRAKYEAEQVVKQTLPSTTIVRPSALFGHEDRLLNLIGLFSAIPFGYPVVNHGKAIRHPLYVGDFTEGLLRLCKIDDGRFDGKTFDFIGPQAYTFRQLTEYFSRHTLRQHPILNLPPLLMLLYSRMFPEWRRPVFTRNGVKELLQDEEMDERHLGLADLGFTQLQTLDNLSVSFIRGFRPVFAYPRPL